MCRVTVSQPLKVNSPSSGWPLNPSTSGDSPPPVTSGCLVSCFVPVLYVCGQFYITSRQKQQHVSLTTRDSYRRLHVGDLDVRHQALPGREEQRRDWPDRERRAIGHASSVPAHPLQPDDKVLVVRSQQAAAIHRAQDATQVL